MVGVAACVLGCRLARRRQRPADQAPRPRRGAPPEREQLPQGPRREAPRRREPGRDHRQERGDAQGHRPPRQGRRHARHRADRGRDAAPARSSIAAAVHYRSRRRDKLFVAPELRRAGREPPRERALRPQEGLVHRRGARREKGLFEIADGGTLFLDEIGEIAARRCSRSSSARCRRARFGASATIAPKHVDVRIVAATQPRPRGRGGRGRFREDLYYRLNVFPIRCRRCASAATTSRCSPSHFLRSARAALGAGVDAVADARARALAALRLAGQHPRAAERHRARGDPRPRRRDRAAAAGATVRAAAFRGR